MTDMNQNKRLRANLREFLAIDGRDRISKCWAQVYAPTPQTKAAFQAFTDCMEAPESSKPRGAVVIGEADTGKSRTMRAFLDRHPARLDADSEYIHAPVLYIRAPDGPSKSALLKSVLDALGYPCRYNPTEQELKAYTVQMIRRCRVGTIMIDEFHDIAQGQQAGSRVTDFLGFLKNLINDTGRPFIVAGTPLVRDLISRDTQMVGRLNQLIELKKFKMEEFTLALGAFEAVLPLRRASNLRDEAIILATYTATEGYIGRLAPLLEDACRDAILSGHECVTLETIERVKGRTMKSMFAR